MSSETWSEITTPDDLVDLLGEPSQRVRDKNRPALVDLDTYYGPSYADGLYR